jgi:hypothetical protein
LFLGAVGTKKSATAWSIAYKFAASWSETNIHIGNITVTGKSGWSYLDVRSRPYVSNPGTAKATLVMSPHFAYVHRVYDEADFAGIGIGSP